MLLGTSYRCVKLNLLKATFPISPLCSHILISFPACCLSFLFLVMSVETTVLSSLCCKFHLIFVFFFFFFRSLLPHTGSSPLRMTGGTSAPGAQATTAAWMAPLCPASPLEYGTGKQYQRWLWPRAATSPGGHNQSASSHFHCTSFCLPN